MGIMDEVVDASAASSPRYPKIGLWGREGLGKTVTALAVARFIHEQTERKLFGIDADGGLGAYQNDPDWNKLFRYIYAESPVTAVDAMDELLVDPRDYGITLIDPISNIYRDTQYKVEQHERDKKLESAGKHISQFSSALHQGSWGPIKRWNFMLMQRIRRIKMPIIVTARVGNLWVGNDIVGEKPDAEGNFSHEFDIVIRLIRQGDLLVGLVSKDRWHKLPTRLETKEGDPFWIARALLEAYSPYFALAPAANPMASQDQVNELEALQRTLQLNPVDFYRRLRNRYGADGLEELTPAQAGELISILREQENPAPNGA